MPTTPMAIHKFRQTTTTKGHWTFSEGTGTTLADASGNAHPGTLQAGIHTPLWKTTGRHKFSLQFDGVDDWVDVTDHADLNPANITLLAWIQPFTGGVQLLVDKQRISNRTGYSFAITPNISLQLGIGGGVFGDATGSITVSANLWHFVAGTYDGSNIRVYLDGALGATTALAGSLAVSTLDLRFGDRADQSVPTPYNGLLDNVQIRTVAMTTAEIAAEFQLQTRVTCYA